MTVVLFDEPPSGPRPRAADDTVVIRQRLAELTAIRERRCFSRAGLPTPNCWCIGGGPNGGHLPCSAASDAPAPATEPVAAAEPNYGDYCD